MATCAKKPQVGRQRCARRMMATAIGAAAIVIAAAGVCAFRPTEPMALTSFRHQPLAVEATSDALTILSENDLRVLVQHVKPSWERPRVAALIHCLRLWGQGA